MIILKNRGRRERLYQFPKTVSAGPVKPKRMKVYRSVHNPRTGEISRREVEIQVGGVLRIGPKESVTIPEHLLNHPGIQRDIKARALIKKSA